MTKKHEKPIYRLIAEYIARVIKKFILRLLHNSQLFYNMRAVDQSKISIMSFGMTEKYRSSGFCASSPYLALVSRGILYILLHA